MFPVVEPFSGPSMAASWAWVGILALAGVVFGGLCAQVAFRKGRSPARWLVLGLLFSAFAFLYLCIAAPAAGARALPSGLRKMPLTRDPSRCPGCGHPNHPSARRCLGCGGALTPSAHSEAAAAQGE